MSTQHKWILCLDPSFFSDIFYWLYTASCTQDEVWPGSTTLTLELLVKDCLKAEQAPWHFRTLDWQILLAGQAVYCLVIFSFSSFWFVTFSPVNSITLTISKRKYKERKILKNNFYAYKLFSWLHPDFHSQPTSRELLLGITAEGISWELFSGNF